MTFNTDLKSREMTEIFSVLFFYGMDYKKISIEKNNFGFVNKTYLISVGNKKWILRKSNPMTSIKHLKLEADLLNYLQKKNFKLTPRIIPNKKGQLITTYRSSFFTLQGFMPGQVKASWNNLKNFDKKRLANLSGTVANFSRTVERFPFFKNCEPGLLFYVKNASRLLKESFDKIPPSAGRRLLKNKLKDLSIVIKKIVDDFKKTGYGRLQKQIVHFDLHPGNVHFKGNKVVALFDFDWVRYDSRFSDIASAIGQSCYYFGGKNDGKYRTDYLQCGLSSYRKIYGKSDFSLKQEKELIKTALDGYMFFQLLWAIDLYANNHSKDNLFILNHFLNVLLLNDYDWLFSQITFSK